MIRVFTAPHPHGDPGAAAPATRPRRLLTTLLLVVALALVLAGAPRPGVGLTVTAYAAAAATPSAPPTSSPHALRTAKNGAILARAFNASHVQTPTADAPGPIIYVDRDATGANNDVVTNVAEFDGPAQTKPLATFTVLCVNSYTVTNGDDTGEGSLRQGIATVCDGSTISFGGDTSIYLASELGINRELAIDGTGHAVTVSGDTNHDGSPNVRPFNIGASGVVTLTHMTIDNGTAASGGGIYNGGTLTVRNSTLTHNAATLDGGGVYNDGTLTVVNSTLSNNSASGNGGAILSGGSLTVTSATLSSNTANKGGGIYTTGGTEVISSTLSGNSASEYGGAIANYDYGNLTIEASTLMGNHTSKGGGGVYIRNWATTNLLNSTIEGNSVDAYQYGGGIDQNGGTLYARNSTITGNTGLSIGAGLVNWAGPIHLTNMVIAYNEGGDCYNPQSSELATNDHNLIGSTEASWANCGIADGAGGTRVGIDPQLGPLADNGGSTLTRAVLYGSPAKDSGSTNCPAADQRGVPRDNGTCDIGAYEGTYEVGVPPMVTGLTIEAAGGNAVKVSWAAAPPATSYEVWTAADEPYFTLTPGASCASPNPYRCTVTTATEFPDAMALGDLSESYTYRVRALNAIGSGALSDRVVWFTLKLTR